MNHMFGPITWGLFNIGYIGDVKKMDAQAFPSALVRSMVWMILALRQDAALLGFDADATRFSKKKYIYR